MKDWQLEMEKVEACWNHFKFKLILSALTFLTILIQARKISSLRRSTPAWRSCKGTRRFSRSGCPSRSSRRRCSTPSLPRARTCWSSSWPSSVWAGTARSEAPPSGSLYSLTFTMVSYHGWRRFRSLCFQVKSTSHEPIYNILLSIQGWNDKSYG